MQLAEFQHQFRQALHYQASAESCGIVSDQFSAEQRIQIYRNNFVMSLNEVLALTYPKTLALLGEECFEQMARQHVLSVPLHTGDVSQYGRGFAKTLERFPNVSQAVPYCVEFARLEDQLDESQQRQNEFQMPQYWQSLEQLSQLEPAQHQALVLHLFPGCTAFRSHYAVFSLFTAIETQQFDQLEIAQGEQGILLCHQATPPRCITMTPAQYELVCLLEQPLPHAQIPVPLLAELAFLFELGIFAGFSLAPQGGSDA